jgi:hypothetical protein
MSWVITPAFRDGIVVSDSDANTYLRAVETADGQPLEPAVAWAVNNFIVGCKADGIWTAIKASCILAGARTLSGALVPLVGTAPTNFNFVSGDYNRKTGLVGNGSTKYLNSNRNNNADPQDNAHLAVYLTNATSTSAARGYLGAGAANTGSTQITSSGSSPFSLELRCRASAAATQGTASSTGFIGMSRTASSSFNSRVNSIPQVNSVSSQTPYNGNVFVFARENSGSAGAFSDGRFAFYSIGESLDLALLDARVTTMVNAFAAAIP